MTDWRCPNIQASLPAIGRIAVSGEFRDRGLVATRRAWVAALVAGGAGLLAACSSNSSYFSSFSTTPAPNAQPAATLGTGQVKAALILPLSAAGNAGIAGPAMRNAADMALAEFNAPNVQLLVKDDAGSPDGARQVFAFVDRGGFLESVEEVPEPHAFNANVKINGETYPATFEEHEHAHGAAARDNNMRAAVIHVIADAAVSVLVIVGLLLALTFGWLWMDPLAGIVGACVIASWSYGLIRDTGAILLDMNPDRRMADDVRRAIESEGDKLGDLHLWRLGPGHLGAIVCVVTPNPRGESYYREKLARFEALSHLTIEVRQAA